MDDRRCWDCRETKPLTEFYKSKSRPQGINPRCRVCCRANAAIHGARYKTNARQKSRSHSRAVYRADPEKARAAQRTYYAKHAAEINTKAKLLRLAHPERHAASVRNWRNRNMGVVYALNAARRISRVKGVVPAWADLEKIKQIYKDAVAMSERTGIKYHVDHIIPIKSDIVCGLHCEANLTIVSATMNLIKGNRTWPDMP